MCVELLLILILECTCACFSTENFIHIQMSLLVINLLNLWDILNPFFFGVFVCWFVCFLE